MQRFNLLRVGVDWLTFRYNKTVKKSVYSGLADGVEYEIAGVVIRFSLHLWQTSAVLDGLGWYVRIQDPSIRPDGKLRQYPIEIQARGHAWSGGVDFLQAVDDWESILGISVRDDERVPGRVDLAADVWIRDGEPSPVELYKLLTARGDEDLVPLLWTLRARRLQKDGHTWTDAVRSPVRKVGSISKLQTVYLGHRRGAQLVIYEKTQEFKGNTLNLVEPQWLHAGWEKGNGIVVRFEFRISREFLREQSFPVLSPDGEIVTRDGEFVSLSQILDAIPDLWNTCLSRFRLCPYNGNATTRKRPESPLWATLRDNPPTLFGPGLGKNLTHMARKFYIERLKRNTVHSLINLELGTGDLSASIKAWADSRSSDEREEYIKKSPWRGFSERMSHGKQGRKERVYDRGKFGK